MNIKLESLDQALVLASLHTFFKTYFSNSSVKSFRIDLINSFNNKD